MSVITENPTQRMPQWTATMTSGCSLNRFYALRELVDQAEMKVSPETSSRLAEMRRIQKRKSKSRARTLAKTVYQENA